MKIEAEIKNLLSAQFAPVYLEVLNESHQHSVAKNSETHFKVTLVSEKFDGSKALARHRAVYECLAGPLRSGVHALALHTFSPSEWEATQKSADSPHCRGGAGK